MILKDANTTSVYSQGEPNFGTVDFAVKTYLTVESDATKVDRNDEYQEYCDPDGWADRMIPELDQGGCGTNLSRY